MKLRTCLQSRSAAGFILMASLAVPAIAKTPQNHQDVELKTSDIHILLRAGEHAPSLTQISDAKKSHLWHSSSTEELPAAVDIHGVSTPVTWTYKPTLSSIGLRRIVFVYESSQPQIRLSSQWEARASFGPIEHRITIQNMGGEELWLPLVDSLSLNWSAPRDEPLQSFYVEKGADTPSDHGVQIQPVNDGYQWIGRSSTYAHPVLGEAREIIPIELVYAPGEPNAGWYAGIEFSGRTRITLDRSDNQLQSRLGLNPELGPFRTRLPGGGSFETPDVFLGMFTGGPDGAGNQIRPWVRKVLNNPLTWNDLHYPLMVNNSWGSGMQVDEPLALRMISDSRELGLEMFQVDAGWFRGVGDWYPDPRKFPHGLAPIADEAHRQGLRFGLWVDWAQAGLDTSPGALNVRDPKIRDWLVNDLPPDWKPEEFKGQTIDLGAPAAQDYAAREVKRIVEDYHLDMLEHDGYVVAQSCTRQDHPHAPPNRSLRITHDSGFDFAFGANSTDVSYHAVRAYYAIYEKLRREHTGLLLEICNDGGRMVDFGSAAHGDYFSITDSYDPLSNRRALYDASYVLPTAMLESYIEKWPTPNPGSFLYMLRSGMMGWMTIMLDTTQWSAEQHAAAKHSFAVYKNQLRPLIRDARFYHVSARPDGVHWDGVEYWDPARRKGVVFAFRGTIVDETKHRFILQGLDAIHRYRLRFEDGTVQNKQLTGRELMRSGLEVRLENPVSSDLVFLEDVDVR